MMVKLGVCFDDPRGAADALWFCPNGGARAQVPLTGSWFIDAFIGPMRNLHRIEGQHCQMDRLVDRMRQIEQLGGQDVAVGSGSSAM